jgi:hypothetical protein
MNDKVKSYMWFLGFLVATKIIVAPIVNGMVPKNAAGVPYFQL